MRPAPSAALPFNPPYAEDDKAIAARLLAGARLSPEREKRVDAQATRLIEAIRAKGGGLGGVEEMLREYALSTKEGLALMVLAEALLRVPDAATADRLIEDKLGQADFAGHEAKSDAFLVSASAWALGITARIIQPGETPESILGQLTKRLGLPAVRTATRQAMRVMGNHFVLGQTIEEALKRAGSSKGRRLPLFLRHARRRRPHGRRCAPLFRILRRRHRRHRPLRRQRAAAEPPRHLGEALGAASALRGDEPRAGDARTRAARRSSWRDRRSPTTSISPSMRRRPTGSNCRSR